MTLFFVTFGFAAFILVVSVPFMSPGRLVPRLPPIFLMALGFAIAMPQGQYPSDDQSWGGLAVVAIGIFWLTWPKKSKHTSSSSAKPPGTTEDS